ncbi:MAG: sulfatase [Puniceicoccaceae bacterium]
MNAIKNLFLSMAVVSALVATLSAQPEKPNVILIICDDLNTDLQGYGGHPQAQTPNVQKLMDSGISFKSAHCTIPICAPSRGSFLTGIYPHNSRYYDFSKWHDNEMLDNTRSIFGHFKANGYHVMGTGKLFHHHLPREFNEFENEADYGPHAWDGTDRVPHPAVPEPMRSDFGWVDGGFGPLVDIEGKDFGDGESYEWRTGNWKGSRKLHFDEDGNRVDPTADELNGQWAVRRLKELAKGDTGKPFLMAVGFLRPHTPLTVDQRFFDQFPLEKLGLPVILDGDVEDTFLTQSRGGNDRGRDMYNSLVASFDSREEALKTYVQAYLACVASVDELIGQMVDVVDSSSLKDKTIIVVTSDHGWGNGQKDYLYKNALWEESTRVPLIIRAPGVARPASATDHPVSLVDLYPTLIDLCDLPTDTLRSERGHGLDGFSLKPFMEDPCTKDWEGPDAALTAIHRWENFDPAEQSYSLRNEDWRYIRYHTGDEELYNKVEDPYEWKNLAGDPDQKERIKAFRKQLKARLAS